MNRGIKLSFAMTLGFCGLTGFSGAVLTSPNLFATEISATASANATVTVPEACTMTSGSNNDSPHAATISAGTNQSDIGLTTFKVICNDTEGFSVYAVGYANYELGNTKLLANIGGTLAPTYDIETGLSMANTTSAWAMKLTAVSGTYAPTIQTDTNGSFASYHVVPATNTKVATFAGVTDGGNNASGSAFTATYRANIANTQPAGTYNGKVKYTMVHPANATVNSPQDCGTANRICYYPNANGVYEGTMGQQTANANTSVTLIASNFSKEGYGFAGWSDAYDYVVNEGSPSNPDAHIYGPNETLTTPSSMSNGLSLYAVWIKSQGNLQGWTGCNSLGQGKVTALTDKRDGQVYAVAKLADDKCWMIENLRLESTNSDNSAGALAQGYGTSATYGNFSGLADAESANFTDSTTANSLYYSGTQSGTATINIGTGSFPAYRMPRYNNVNTQSRATSPTSGGNNIYSYGNYYTWAAAIADTTNYSSGDHGTTSLCPTGWRLPIGSQSTASNSFGALSVALGGPADGATADSSSTPTGTVMSKIFRSYPNNFLYSGSVSSSSVNNRGSNGYYWPSTANSDYVAYRLGFGSTGVGPGTNYSNKYVGVSVRCVAGS